MSDPRVYFFFLSGAKKGKIEHSDAQVVRIGRQPYCEVPLDAYQDIPASGDHCHVIRENDGRYWLLDSGSTFGTWLNDVRIEGRVELKTGDTFECGRDDQGRVGPKIKFYLETDVRKCPICSGPVYKRHFRCPACHRKTCLRCIDFGTKSCKQCAPAVLERLKRGKSGAKKPESAGFEVLPDDAEVTARKPAKVVIKGKEAQKLKKKKDKKTKVAKALPPKSPDGASASKSRGDLDSPFCPVCCEFASGPVFTCPACSRPVCESHRQGKVCGPCAGVAGDAPSKSGAKKTRAIAKKPEPEELLSAEVDGSSSPELPVPPSVEEDPDMAGFERVEPAAPSPSASGKKSLQAPADKFPRLSKLQRAVNPEAMSPPPARPQPAPQPQARGAQPPTPLAPGSTARLSRDAANRAPAPGAMVCARCGTGLGQATSFQCVSCGRMVCLAHRAAGSACDECYLLGRASARGPTPVPQSPWPPTAPAEASPWPQSLPPGARPAARPPARPAPPVQAASGWGDEVIDREVPTSERPAGFRTMELPAAEIVMPEQPSPDPFEKPDTFGFDPSEVPTLHDIEMMDMMPLLETEKDEDDDLASDGESEIGGLTFECPYCDAAVPPEASHCPRCRKKL